MVKAAKAAKTAKVVQVDEGNMSNEVAPAPAPTLNFDIDPNLISSLLPIVNAAWNNVRGDDPPFGSCAVTHQDRLLAHARSALKVGPLAGDTAMALFEQEVCRLRNEAAKG